MNDQFSSEYSRAYDLINSGKDYASEVEFALSLFRRHSSKGANPASILDLGCGSGCHLIHFPPQTRKCGVDQSEGMLAEAASRGMENIRLVHQNIGALQLEERFELVYSLFHVLSYQVEVDTLRSFLRTIAGHLDHDGIAVIDFWHRAPWDHDPPTTRLTTKSSDGLEVCRISEPSFDRVTGTVDISMNLFVKSDTNRGYHRFEEFHRMRAYTLTELELAASSENLQLVASGGWPDVDRPLAPDDWYGWIVFKSLS